MSIIKRLNQMVLAEEDFRNEYTAMTGISKGKRHNKLAQRKWTLIENMDNRYCLKSDDPPIRVIYTYHTRVYVLSEGRCWKLTYEFFFERIIQFSCLVHSSLAFKCWLFQIALELIVSSLYSYMTSLVCSCIFSST